MQVNLPDRGFNRHAVTHLESRFVWVLVFLGFCFFGLVCRLWYLQIHRGHSYLLEAKDNVIAERIITPMRGNIFDTGGRAIATNRPSYSIYVDRKHQIDNKKIVDLQVLLSLSDEEISAVTGRMHRKRNGQRWVKILNDQSMKRIALLKQENLLFEGFEVRDEPFRHYPYGKIASHVVGYLGHLSEESFKRLKTKGYRNNDRIGRVGAEKMLEAELKGISGIERYLVNAKGQRVDTESQRGLIDGPRLIRPQAGHDVFLTVDVDLQTTVEKELLKYAAGAVVVVDVKSGRIRALASTPSFDSNEMSGRLTKARYQQLLTDPRKPFVDKTRRQHYPPGSTYKFVTALAGLEAGIVDESDELTCNGRHKQGKRLFRCHHVHGKQNVSKAIRHSCNIYFWKLSELTGLDRMSEIANQFGFGQSAEFELGEDVKGTVPTKKWYQSRNYFRIGHTLNAATGQGDVEVTVLQMAMAYAAIANGGKLWKPQIVERIVDGNDEVVRAFAPSLRRQINLSESNLNVIRQGLSDVVNHKKGTAQKYAKSTAIQYSGKTGTAQVRSFKHRADDDQLRGWDVKRDHAWFAGYAPSENPEIAFAVLIEHGGSGGKNAGPVAKTIAEHYQASLTKDELPGHETNR